MKRSSPKAQRIMTELSKAGVTGLSAMHPEAHKLVDHVHEDEHIKAAIRGRCRGEGAMFVATDKRMLFLNYKPLFQVNDEISYDVLAGVSYNPQTIYAGVIIHTRMGDFPFRFVRRQNAKKFVEYLERRHVELNGHAPTTTQKPVIQRPLVHSAVISQEAHLFLTSHNIGVFSTINPDGGVNGAAVYYVLAPDGSIYIVTRWATTKAQNVKFNEEVAFTVYDEQMRTTAQLRGIAVAVKSSGEASEVMMRIIKPHVYNKKVAWPPITQITAGPYQVIRISPTDIVFHNFS